MKNRILKFLKLGAKQFKLEYPLEYNDYMKYDLRLQKKINSKIKSIFGFRSIRKVLKQMLTVHFQDRTDIDALLTMIKIKNFDIPLGL